MGRPSGRGCRNARSVRARSGAGPRLLRCAAREAGDGRAERRASRAGAARRRMAGRIAAGHAECRRSARARGLEAAAPHAWRADATAGAWRATSASAGNGPMGEEAACPRCAASGHGPPGHRLVRRDALRHGADRRGAAALRPVRVDRHVGRGLSGCGLRPDRAILRREDAGDQPRAEPRQHLFDESRTGRRASWCRRGWTRCWRFSPPTPARSRDRGRGPRPIAD